MQRLTLAGHPPGERTAPLAEGSGPGSLLASVIVPVFDNADPLRACLRALGAQVFPAGRFEVIVIDNGSADGSPRVAEAAAVRVATELTPGSYAARNRGVSLARGQILAFTDSDCVPDPFWLARGVEHIRREPGTVIAGHIELRVASPAAPTAVELYERFTALQQRRYVEEGGFGATANLFVTRSVFDRVGGFDASLKSGGDVEWCQRAVVAGCRLRYAEDVRVSHPARRTWADLHRKVVRTIGGAHDLKGRARLLGIGRRAVSDWIPPLRYAREAWRSPTLPVRSQKLQVIGVMFGVRYAEAIERLRLRLGGTSRR